MATAQGIDQNGNAIGTGTVTWSTSANSIATVNSGGVVTGVAVGQTDVVARAGAKEGRLSLSVVAPSVSRVEVTPTSVTMLSGETRQLTAAIYDASNNLLSGRTPNWSSSDDAKAVVSSSGVVTAVAAGVATITATVEGKQASATVTVGLPLVELRTVLHRLSNQKVSFHQCALTTNGAAYCWGIDTDGEAGSGSTALRRTTPVAVLGNLTFVSVSTGDSHTCGLTTNNDAYCWGSNINGQLGIGSVSLGVSTPQLVIGGTKFRQLVAGGQHTCGLTMENTVLCWGDNEDGELGNGTTSDRSTPSASAIGFQFVHLTAGDFHTCGVRSDGAAFCWGSQLWGQIGNGNTSSVLVVTTPARVNGGPYATIEAGVQHTCALTMAGEAWCWGSNNSGQVGDGSGSTRASPVRVSGNSRFKTISPGYQSTCAIEQSGPAYCWGANESAGLGDGTLVTRAIPTLQAGGYQYAEIGSNCGMVSGSEVYCWGLNTFGQIGDGTSAANGPVNENMRLIPTRVRAPFGPP